MPHLNRIVHTGAAFRASDPARYWRKAATVAISALALTSAAVCAEAATSNPSTPAADQIGGVGEICQTVIRLQPNGAQYEGCVSSLSGSLQALSQDRALQQAHADCVHMAFKSESPASAECALQSSDIERGASKSYFSASPQEVFRREQLSCARLGFEPDGAAFAGCVADLQATLFAADDPMQ
jgi:hypothetical protein